ncbi:hypothetical protein ACUW97_000760 [Kocuria rhizophila]
MGKERPITREQRIRGTEASLAEHQSIDTRHLAENLRGSTRQANPGVDAPLERAVINGDLVQLAHSAAGGSQR